MLNYKLTLNNMKNLKWLVTVIAVCFAIAFLDGVFSWGLASGFYIVTGLIEIVCIIWLLKIAYSKKSCISDCNDCKYSKVCKEC